MNAYKRGHTLNRLLMGALSHGNADQLELLTDRWMRRSRRWTTSETVGCIANAFDAALNIAESKQKAKDARAPSSKDRHHRDARNWLRDLADELIMADRVARHCKEARNAPR